MKINKILLTAFLICIVVMPFKAIAESLSIPDQWDMRAYLAVKRLEKITADKTDKLDTKKKYETMIEIAYAGHIDNVTKRVLQAKDKRNSWYKLVMDLSNDKNTQKLFVLDYMYDNVSEDLIGMTVEAMPQNSGWTLTTKDRPSRIICLTDKDNNRIIFHDDSPFYTSILMSGEK